MILPALACLQPAGGSTERQQMITHLNTPVLLSGHSICYSHPPKPQPCQLSIPLQEKQGSLDSDRQTDVVSLT